jgi:hypothetical protein
VHVYDDIVPEIAHVASSIRGEEGSEVGRLRARLESREDLLLRLDDDDDDHGTQRTGQWLEKGSEAAIGS